MLSHQDIDSVEFFKLHGCGNDFVFIDNRKLLLAKEKMASWAQAICKPKLGIGADGLVFLDSSHISGVDYIWHFYNSDGSRAEMCGNATRCAGVLAVIIGLAGRTQVLGTDSGLMHITVNNTLDRVTVVMMDPKDVVLNQSLPIGSEVVTVHSVTIGVPHAIIFTTTLDDYDVLGQGRVLRYHEAFSPVGTNVDFVQVENPRHIYIRTYERGVEGETLACGTGVCSAAFIANKLGMVEDQVKVTTLGGDELMITLKDGQVLMDGPVVQTFKGDMNIHSLGLAESFI